MPLAPETMGWQSSRGGSCKTGQGKTAVQAVWGCTLASYAPQLLRAILCSASLSLMALPLAGLCRAASPSPPDSVTTPYVNTRSRLQAGLQTAYVQRDRSEPYGFPPECQQPRIVARDFSELAQALAAL